MTKRSAASSSSSPAPASQEQRSANQSKRVPRLLRELQSDLAISMGNSRSRRNLRSASLVSQKPLSKKRRFKAPCEEPSSETSTTPLRRDTPSSPELEVTHKQDDLESETLYDMSTQGPTNVDADTLKTVQMQNSCNESSTVGSKNALAASLCKLTLMDEMSSSTRNDANKAEASFKPITDFPSESERVEQSVETAVTSEEHSIRAITPDPMAPSSSSTNSLEMTTPTKFALHEISSAEMAQFLEDVLWSSTSPPSDNSTSPSWPPITLVQPFCDTITAELPRGTNSEICGWMVEDDEEADSSLFVI